jgi:hypothetical protein
MPSELREFSASILERLPENELDTDCYNAHCRADDALKPRRWSIWFGVISGLQRSL